MLLHNWGLASALRAAGLNVVETPGWTGRSHGDLPSNPSVVWHHDASPKGDSPGALDWMVNNWGTASAQIWINRYGVVHLVGVGVAWHAGKVLDNQHDFDNFHAIGIETDHTTDEDWPPALLNALRVTTAVILDKGQRDRAGFSFHRLICSPVGRKSDPAGLDLGTERAAVKNIGTVPPELPTAPKPPLIEPALVREGSMFWMYAVGKPIVVVVGGQSFPLDALGDYDAIHKQLVEANVPEHNLGNQVALYDRICEVTHLGAA